MQWLQGSNESNTDKLNTVTLEAGRHFRNRRKEYLTLPPGVNPIAVDKYIKIDELETNGKIRNIRDLYRSTTVFKKDYQATTDLVKGENGDFFYILHTLLPMWRNHLSRLLNVHGVTDVRQTEIRVHTAEPLVPEPSDFWVWDGHWNAKRTQIISYWSNLSRID